MRLHVSLSVRSIWGWGAACIFAFAASVGISAADEPVIIDVHSHIFNLRYLPVEGILVARGVPPLVAKVVDRFLVGSTRLSSPSAAPREADAEPLDLLNMSESEARQDVFRRLDLVTRDEVPLTEEERKALRRFTADTLDRADIKPRAARDQELVRAAVEKARLAPEGEEGDSYFRFLALLMRDEVTIGRAFRADYPRVRLAVHHLMDMEKAYADPPSFGNERQIAKLPELANLLDGRFVAFVAYDPFRRGQALEPVRRAIENGRALGVKFYPPSGYRAAQNRIPRRPAFWRFGLRQQWLSRYNDLDGAELDAFIEPLFAYCERNDVPIFAHCTPGGFQAASGYGLNSDPRFWEAVLAKHPKLRLALGHAGGGDWWFSRTTPPADPHFDEIALRLARRYENVYLDFGYASEVLDPARQAIFVERLRGAVLPDANGLSAASKILYGSDWHMVASLGRRRELLIELERVFANSGLDAYAADFFAGNASRYLKLADYARNPNAPAAVRMHLSTLLKEIH